MPHNVPNSHTYAPTRTHYEAIIYSFPNKPCYPYRAAVGEPHRCAKKNAKRKNKYQDLHKADMLPSANERKGTGDKRFKENFKK